MKIFVLPVIFIIIFNISFGQSRSLWSDPVGESYFTAEQKCLHQYTSLIGSITQEVEADSQSCLKAADIRFQTNKKFEMMQGPMKKCSSPESETKDYFNCMDNIVPVTRRKLKEITSANEFFLQNINKIEQNKTACLRKASSKGNYKSTNAVLYLNLCLQGIPQPKMNSAKDQIEVENALPPEDMNTFLNVLYVIKEKYNQLKACSSDEIYEYCFSEANLDEFLYDERTSMKNYLMDRFASNSSEYFSKITEIDKADDSCLRQYIVMNLNANFKFDLSNCLMHGSRLSQESEENFEKDTDLIGDLIEAYRKFNECRDITRDLDTHNCVHNKIPKKREDFLILRKLQESLWVREAQEAISRKSETNFKSFKETLLGSYTDQYPCIENLYDFLQFDGYNIRPMEKNVLFSCLEKGYKPTAPLPLDEQLIKDLSEIQEFLKTCTAHPKSPGYNRCFRNIIKIYDTTRKYLNAENSNYREIVAEHDMLHETCFEDIVKDWTGTMQNLWDVFILSRQCLFP